MEACTGCGGARFLTGESLGMLGTELTVACERCGGSGLEPDALTCDACGVVMSPEDAACIRCVDGRRRCSECFFKMVRPVAPQRRVA
jgi:hypothetical protein